MEIQTLPKLVRVKLLICDLCQKIINPELSREVLHGTAQGNLCTTCLAHHDE